MGTWCLLGECLAENRAWQAYFLPHAGFHHRKLVEGGLAHLPNLLEALNFEGERDFLMDFLLQSINQPQRNTSEARSGFLAGLVITKPPWLALCLLFLLAPWSEPWGCPSATLARLGLSADLGSQGGEEGKSFPEDRETPWFWNLCWGPSPSFCCMVDGFLQIFKLLGFGVSTGTDQTNLMGL